MTADSDAQAVLTLLSDAQYHATPQIAAARLRLRGGAASHASAAHGCVAENVVGLQAATEGTPNLRATVNTCWSCFKWTLLLCLIGGLVAIPYLYTRVDDEIRKAVEQKLTSHYTDLAVNVRFAKLVEGEGIEIRGISILEPGASGAQAELIYIDEMFLACGTELSELISGVPDVRHVYIRRPRIRAARRIDGSWTAASLWPPPKLSDFPAPITIENGSIEFTDLNRPVPSLLTLRDLNLAITHEHHPDPATEELEHRMQVEGALTGDHLRRVTLRGHIAPARGAWDFDGSVEGMEFAPELIDSLPSELSTRLLPLASLRAQVQVDFQVAQQPAAPLKFRCTCQLNRGRIDDPRLPYPLNDLRAIVHADNQGIAIEQLTARNGQTTLALSCQRDGYEADSPLTLAVESSAMMLDQRLFETLPPAMQDVWRKFYPRGQVDLKAKLAFDGAGWHAQELAVDCLNVSFLPYITFPYRLERGTGTLRLADNALSIDLVAFNGAREVRINGQVHNPGPDFTGEITAEAPVVEFDDNLFNALPDTSRDVVRSLNPSGTFHCVARFGRTDPAQELSRYVWARLNHCSLRYDKFPYPLSNIRGVFVLDGSQWTFSDLEGVNDTGVVQCSGHLKPLAVGSELLLNFTAQNLSLEEELREALPPRAQSMWSTLRPRGQVDLPHCQVLYRSEEGRPVVDFRMELQGDTTSIEPLAFPYRLEKLQGAVLFHDGQVRIERLRAEHGRTRLHAHGDCVCHPDGAWQLKFTDLTVDQLHTDRELVQALPGRLKKAVAELNPTGPVNVRGALNLFGVAEPGAPVKASWDVALDFNQLSLDAGLRIDQMSGGVRLLGNFDGSRAVAWGSLNLDSLIYKNWQFTEVAGPIWIDDQRIYLGRDAGPHDANRAPRRITARLYGGQVVGDCWVTLGATPRYSLQAELQGADLARVTGETMPGRQNLSGQVFAKLELSGQPSGQHTLRGGGSVQLRDADIYQLPLMVSLLKILSVRPPDTTAFTESDIDFRIHGHHIYFDRMNFNGDAISLRGNGEMDFNQEINLNFHAAVGKRELPIPILREVVKGASQQFMQLHVTGTVDAPLATAEAFPGVNQAFKDLEAGLQGTPSPK